VGTQACSSVSSAADLIGAYQKVWNVMGRNCYPACYLPIACRKHSGGYAMCETWIGNRRCPIIFVTLRRPRSLQPPTISSAAPKRQTMTLRCSFRILSYMSTSQNNTSMSPEESVPDAHSNPVSPGGEQTDLSSPEQAPPSLL
jgi:hypothetical protein